MDPVLKLLIKLNPVVLNRHNIMVQIFSKNIIKHLVWPRKIYLYDVKKDKKLKEICICSENDISAALDKLLFFAENVKNM